MKVKKAQAWSFDMIAAMTLFIIGILAFFLFSLNQEPDEQTIQKLKTEANILTEALLEEGYPTDWNATNVVFPGLTTKDRINESKLENLYLLQLSDYQRSKNLFRINFDYYISFQENITLSNGTIIVGIGKKPTGATHILKVTRFTVYKEKPQNMEIQLWKI